MVIERDSNRVAPNNVAVPKAECHLPGVNSREVWRLEAKPAIISTEDTALLSQIGVLRRLAVEYAQGRGLTLRDPNKDIAIPNSYRALLN